MNDLGLGAWAQEISEISEISEAYHLLKVNQKFLYKANFPKCMFPKWGRLHATGPDV